MAKAQAAARFMTEVAPPQVVSIMRRRTVPRSLDTIAEDDREQLVACGSDHLHHQAAAASSSGFAEAWSRRAPAPARARTTGGFMGDLGMYFSDGHGQAGSWESSRQQGHRRGVHAQQLHKNGA